MNKSPLRYIRILIVAGIVTISVLTVVVVTTSGSPVSTQHACDLDDVIAQYSVAVARADTWDELQAVHDSYTTTLETCNVTISPTAIPHDEQATVTRVIDGDTIEVLMNATTHRVRYIGMNTPETYETCADEATRANAALVEGRTVVMIRDVSETDRYGRLLRYVYVDDTFVNAELVRDGFAEAADYPPDIANSELFHTLEAEARSAQIGCHPTGVFGGSVQSVPTVSITPSQNSAFTCDCSKTCGAMVSCDEAYFQLNTCGCGRRDGDNDGVPCESICPGG